MARESSRRAAIDRPRLGHDVRCARVLPFDERKTLRCVAGEIAHAVVVSHATACQGQPEKLYRRYFGRFHEQICRCRRACPSTLSDGKREPGATRRFRVSTIAS